jgi:hypothetical protein
VCDAERTQVNATADCRKWPGGPKERRFEIAVLIGSAVANRRSLKLGDEQRR